MASLVPADRPTNLTNVFAPAGKAPVDLPDEPTEEDVFDWAERLRDHYEQKGNLLTPKGLIHTARSLGRPEDETKTIVRTLKDIYREEYLAEKAIQGGKPDPADPPEKETPKPVKEEKKVTATTTTKEKPAPKSAPKPKNGSKAAPKTAPSKTKPAAKNKTTSNGTLTALKFTNRSKIKEVEAYQTEGGMRKVTVFGVPARAVLRAMGYHGYSYDDGVKFLQKLGIKDFIYNPDEHYTDHIRDQMCSGAKSKELGGKKAWAGEVPQLTKEQLAAIKTTVNS